MGIWLEAKPLAEKIKEGVKRQAAHYQQTTGKVPGLAAVLVGDNRASQVYVRSKEKACQALGLFSEVQVYPGDISQAFLEKKIDELNRRDGVAPRPSILVGKSRAPRLTNENGTVPVCHSKTKDLGRVCSRADILVAA